jgi:hypothetical protein
MILWKYAHLRLFLENGVSNFLPGTVTFDVRVGNILTIHTPGGGGFLFKEQENKHGN